MVARWGSVKSSWFKMARLSSRFTLIRSFSVVVEDFVGWVSMKGIVKPSACTLVRIVGKGIVLKMSGGEEEGGEGEGEEREEAHRPEKGN